MRSFAQAGMAWLRGLFGGGAGEGDAAELAHLAQAVAHTALLASDVVGHLDRQAPSAAAAARQRGAAAANAFGRVVVEVSGADGRAAVATACGAALAGARAAAFAPGEQLADAGPALIEASRASAPLVLHVDLGGGGLGSLADLLGAGPFVVAPATPQEAVDLALVARRLAELSLTPGVVAADVRAVGPVVAPAAGLVRDYLGAPGASLAAPTAAQRLVFGAERPRAYPWFDAQRPATSGALQGVGDRALAAEGRRVFGGEALVDLARRALDELTALTGRPLPAAHAHQTAGARWVIVTAGAAFEAARGAAEALRAAGRPISCGALGLTWLEPLALSPARDALANAHGVLVVEAGEGEPRLLRALRGRGLAPGARWVSAIHSRGALGLASARLAAAVRAAERDAALTQVRLDLPGAAQAGFPRRDALLQEVATEHPALAAPAAPREGTRRGADPVVAWVGDPAAHADPLLALARAAGGSPAPRGAAWSLAPGRLEARVVLGATGAPADAVDVLLLSGLPAAGDPFRGDLPWDDLAPGAAVVIGTPAPADRVWERLPGGWRARWQRVPEGRLLVGPPELTALAAAGVALARGEAAGALTAVAPGGPEAARPLPLIARRQDDARRAPDSAARAWGELVQPRLGGGGAALEPLVAAAGMPACSAAFDRAAAPGALPALDPAACTGCGRCWTVCPDSAIGAAVLAPQALLDAAAEAAGVAGPAAAAARRAHKHVAGRLAAQGAGSEPITAEAVERAFAWAFDGQGLAGDARAAQEEAARATAQALGRLAPVRCEVWFEAPERARKGAGELLVLAVDPRTCQGCLACVTACEAGALRPEALSGAALEQRWAAWEALPDTAGATVARAADLAEVGRMAGLLLSRHAGQALVGGGGSEPGSGERLAVRLVTGALEAYAQPRLVEVVDELSGRRAALEAKARELVSQALADVEPKALEDALAALNGGRVGVSDLGARLEALGARTHLDRAAALRAAGAAREVADAVARLTEGASGLGRARFGVAVVGDPGRWAGRFPFSPFAAPAAVHPDAAGLEVARGLAHGLRNEHLELTRLRRRAAIALENRPDAAARIEALAGLTWGDLEAAEQASLPPLLVLCDDRTAGGGRGLALLGELLASDLAIKVVLLDGLGRLGQRPHPALAAVAQRTAYVVSSSVAHPDHLAAGLAGALAWPGPALIHLHAPSPGAHGFDPDAAVARARAAVAARVHPLVRFDPAPGGIGAGLSLAGNPDVEREWATDAEGGPATPAHWARGERRFGRMFAPLDGGAGAAPLAVARWAGGDAAARAGKQPTLEGPDGPVAVSRELATACVERLETWRTLQELAGIRSPFAAAVRAEVEVELRAEFDRRLAEAKVELGLAADGSRAELERAMAARLRERLLVLARARPGALGSS